MIDIVLLLIAAAAWVGIGIGCGTALKVEPSNENEVWMCIFFWPLILVALLAKAAFELLLRIAGAP